MINAGTATRAPHFHALIPISTQTPHFALQLFNSRPLNHHHHPHSTSPQNETTLKMASFLASIFGTELDKVNCSFYFVSLFPLFPIAATRITS